MSSFELEFNLSLIHYFILPEIDSNQRWLIETVTENNNNNNHRKHTSYKNTAKQKFYNKTATLHKLDSGIFKLKLK